MFMDVIKVHIVETLLVPHPLIPTHTRTNKHTQMYVDTLHQTHMLPPQNNNIASDHTSNFTYIHLLLPLNHSLILTSGVQGWLVF